MIVSVLETADLLQSHHYLGPIKRGKFAWKDDDGCMVFSNPSSRHLPPDWLELTRWCLVGGKDAGSRQWSRFLKWAQSNRPETTVVSYSDPAQGHTGALYRACGWRWAPTWHRLRTPPSGNGSWDGVKCQAVKDRWIYTLGPDDRREAVLRVKDSGCQKTWWFASYVEPPWRRGTAISPGYSAYKLFIILAS